MDGMVLNSGAMLQSFEHERRFEQLQHIDWKITLWPEAAKTHREVHSLWGVFAMVHRVLLAHSILFVLARIWSVSE